MTEKLTYTYQEAFFKALKIVFKAADESNFKDVTEELFELLEELEDVQGATEFVAEQAYTEGPETLMRAIEFIKKKALASVKSAEKPETPTEDQEDTPGAGGSG